MKRAARDDHPHLRREEEKEVKAGEDENGHRPQLKFRAPSSRLPFYCPHPCHTLRLLGTRLPHLMNLRRQGLIGLAKRDAFMYRGRAGRLAGNGSRPDDSPFNL